MNVIYNYVHVSFMNALFSELRNFNKVYSIRENKNKKLMKW